MHKPFKARIGDITIHFSSREELNTWFEELPALIKIDLADEVHFFSKTEVELVFPTEDV